MNIFRKRPAEDGPTQERRMHPEFKNAVHLETDNARYTIVYGVHTIAQDPKVLQGSDGLVLEMAGDYSDPTEIDSHLRGMQNNFKQTTQIIEHARTNRIPIYLVDTIHLNTQNELLRLQEDSEKKQNYAGIFAVLGLLSTIGVVTSKGMNRRNFLKSAAGAGGAFVGAGYLSLPEIEMYLTKQMTKGIKQPEQDELLTQVFNLLHKMNETLHPKTRELIYRLRNLLIAEKAEYLGHLHKVRSRGKKPNLTLLVGQAHTGIEQFLQQSFEERANPILEKLRAAGVDESTIAKVDYLDPEFNPKKVNVEFISDPNISINDSHLARK
jgi:hypothetical protein